MGKTRKAAAICVFALGLGMIGWWTVALLNDQMPELYTAPIAAVLHLVAEFLTGAALMIGGYGLLMSRWWGEKIHLVSLGMVLYIAILATGYYGQQGNMAIVVMFAGIAVFSFTFIGIALWGQGVQKATAEPFVAGHGQHEHAGDSLVA